MSLVAIPASAGEYGVDWMAVKWHSAIHIVGATAPFVLWRYGAISSYTVCLMVGVFLYGHLSIRLGAHSLYTHQAYNACYALHRVLVIGYSLVMQGPLLFLWCPVHVLHHRSPETDLHNVADGWLWAHMMWSCFNLPKINYLRTTPWLFRHRTPAEQKVAGLLAWQAKYTWWLGIGLGIVLPGFIAMSWGDYIGGFLLSFSRLLLQYHFTWQINSLSHLVGPQPYTREDSSRDSPWYFFGVPALLSVGEAWRHNFHHRYPRSCRIGWLDPGWWALWSLWRVSRLMRLFGFGPIVWGLHVYDNRGKLTVLP